MANSSNGSEPKGITNQPLPASRKVYVESTKRSDVRVAMRAIALSGANGAHGGSGHAESVAVYDTSGP